MWDRLLWGIEFTGASKDEAPILIGTLWAKVDSKPYPGEPTRALLFCTREEARKWCAEKMREWQEWPENDPVRRWRVRPVRVREVVRKSE